jgi:hypothetical protein
MKKFDLKKKMKETLIKEELSSSSRKALVEDLEEEIEDAIDRVMLSHGVETQGLSEQQAALCYRKLCGKLEDVIDDYSTIQIQDPKIRNAARELTGS